MALSDMTRKQARSDVLSRLDEIGSEALDPAENNRWLDMGQFDFFNKMAALAHKWYGTSATIAGDNSGITASAGAVTAVPLEGNYAATKIAQMNKLILADATTIVRPTEFNSLEHYVGISSYDSAYYYAWFGENLHVFVGTSAEALSSEAAILYFIRKPDEMGGDINVHTVTVATYSDKTDGDQIIIDGIVLEQRAAATEKATFVAETSNNATAQNIDDLIGNVFGSVSGVTVSVSSAIVTITGAKTVTVSQTTSTFLTVAQSTASMLDVPTEYTDLVIMYAQARALGKLKRQDLRAGVEQDISQMYGAIHGLFAEELQIRAAEKPAGIISNRRLE